MAFTAILVRDGADAEDLCRSTLYISQEYLPHKERDESGAVLPNQEWQHPEPSTLCYCEAGTFQADERVAQLLDSMLTLGNAQFGGHGRYLVLDECPWITDRLETWESRQARSAQDEEERFAEEERIRYEAEMERAPVYGYCETCGQDTEQCKGPRHRGRNLCMSCGGGLADPATRQCSNCVDLPYREKRERAAGEPIVYRNEEPG